MVPASGLAVCEGVVYVVDKMARVFANGKYRADLSVGKYRNMSASGSDLECVAIAVESGMEGRKCYLLASDGRVYVNGQLSDEFSAPKDSASCYCSILVREGF